MKCRYCDKEAVAIINKNCPMCKKHQREFAAEVLNRGLPLGIAVRGEAKALLIPQEERKSQYRDELKGGLNTLKGLTKLTSKVYGLGYEDKDI